MSQSIINIEKVLKFISDNSFTKIIVDLEDARIFDLTDDGLNTLKADYKRFSDNLADLVYYKSQFTGKPTIEFDDDQRLTFDQSQKQEFIDFCKNIIDSSSNNWYFVFEIFD